MDGERIVNSIVAKPGKKLYYRGRAGGPAAGHYKRTEERYYGSPGETKPFHAV
jgi:hypothetical protein